MEDSGGIAGWNRLKRAFRAQDPSSELHDLISWAKDASGLGDRFDPFAEPNITVMNYEGRWENHLIGFMEYSGESTAGMLDLGSEEDDE